MATIVTRSGKGSALTHTEMDANFNNLNGAKVETSAIGTAAASDVTTSSTDTTAGRLLKVGDFGIGSSSVIVSGSDANTISATGSYYLSSGLNIPFANGHLKYERISDLYGYQTFVSGTADTSDGFWVRRENAGVWGEWKKIYHTGSEQQIGVNQTWQDVSASRTYNTTYTNTTGKPIMVSCGFTLPVGAYSRYILVDGLKVAEDANGYGANNAFRLTAIVPNGSTYLVNATMQYWFELR